MTAPNCHFVSILHVIREFSVKKIIKGYDLILKCIPAVVAIHWKNFKILIATKIKMWSSCDIKNYNLFITHRYPHQLWVTLGAVATTVMQVSQCKVLEF